MTCRSFSPPPATGSQPTNIADLSPTYTRRGLPPTANSGWRRHVRPCWVTSDGMGHSAARELRSALPEIGGTYDPAPGKPWGGTVPVAPRVLTVLSARGEIVRGPNDGSWTTSKPRWVPTTDWLGKRAAPVDAVAVLTRRWLHTFGPATAADVKWWFGTTLTAARKALGDIGAVRSTWTPARATCFADDLEIEPEVAPSAALLPGLDVTTMGWFDRDWYLGEHRGQVFDRNGNAGPTAWWNGRVVGGWYQDRRGARPAATPGRSRPRRAASVDSGAPPNSRPGSTASASSRGFRRRCRSQSVPAGREAGRLRR